jgi:threonylcarbamoyladenosine tRNA methylthiotransferase MtaB
LERTPNLPPRIRLSSIEPTDVNERLISAIGNSNKICPHLHIPLQSGDNEILLRMNRGYTREGFAALIGELAEKIPALCLGLDVIGGFPGEGETHFRNTVDLIEQLPVAYLHVFPFSPRPGTVAFDDPQKVRGDEIRQRCMTLRKVGQGKRESFYRGFLHQRVRVLEETTTLDEKGRWKSLSRNYIPVWIAPGGMNPSEEVDVEIIEVRNHKVLGRRV